MLREPRPAAALAAHESAGKASTLKPLGEIPAPLQRHLDDNLEWMSDLDAMAMPAIFYRDTQGRLQQQQGAARPQALTEILGRAD